jgi:hypothetical protein
LPPNNDAESAVDQIYSLTLRNSFPVPSFNNDLKDPNYTSIININPEGPSSKRASRTTQDVLF